MFDRRTDLQVGTDALGGFLPWLIALMVFLATLAILGSSALHQVAARWDQGAGATLTVQVPSGTNSAEDDRRVAAAVIKLETIHGIVAVYPVTDEAVSRLLSPWLGSMVDSPALPLPRLIDVTLSNDSDTSAYAVQSALATSLPGVVVDDHRIWLAHVVSMIRTAEALAFVILGMIIIACAVTVIFTTRTGLAVHHEAIAVMHLIGAQESYIARQFSHRALVLGLKGGVLGTVMALPVLLVSHLLGEQLPEGMLPEVVFDPWWWPLLAAPPLVAAFIATVTARLTVMRTLGRML